MKSKTVEKLENKLTQKIKDKVDNLTDNYFNSKIMKLTTKRIGHISVYEANKKLTEGTTRLVRSFLKNNRFYQVFSDQTFTMIGLESDYTGGYDLNELKTELLIDSLTFSNRDYNMVLRSDKVIYDLVEEGFINEKEVFNCLKNEIEKRVELQKQIDSKYLKTLQEKLKNEGCQQ